MSFIAPNYTGKTLLKLLLKPQRKSIEQNKLDFLKNSDTSTFSLHNESYAAYHWPNKGPKVLLLHGWESNASRWRPVIKKLQKKHFDIYAIDAPGHGHTTGDQFTPIKYAEAANVIIQNQKIDYLVGHSAGAYAALYYLSEYDSSISKVVALAPTYDMVDILKGMQKALSLNTKAYNALYNSFQKTYDLKPEDFSSESFVQKISIPGLLVHDTEDDILPVTGSDKITKVWKNHVYKKTSGYGHRLRNTEVDNWIVEFLMTSPI